MANVKISDLTPTTTLQSTDLLIISSDNGAGYDTRSITASMLESAGKKVFISKLKQSSTSAPVLTQIQDDFGDTYATSYSGVGTYEVTGFNNELDNDCEIYINVNILTQGHHVRTSVGAINSLSIFTYDETDVLSDGILDWDNVFLKVIKYL